MDRRTFLLAAVPSAFALARLPRDLQQPRPLTTLIEWLNASAPERERALQPLADRIRAQDAGIHAWVQILPQKGTGSGPLSGIPFGAKDIIETRGLSTEYGSPIYKGRIGSDDASIVRMLRDRGAVLMGKTHTTTFAYRTPAPTRNPRNLAHTPGGSSSGSAAAVAAGMVPLAIGTQTGGSTIRPASYCGVAGFKGTYGLLSTEGVFPFAKSLDTLGFFTHTAADLLAFWNAIGQPVGRAEDFVFGLAEPLPDGVEPAMASAFRDAIARLRAAGIKTRPVEIAPALTALRGWQRTIMFYEGARFHEERYKQYGARMEHMGDLVREGLQIPAAQYDDALKQVAAARTRFAEWFKTTPVLLTPAAPGPAPAGLSSTGESTMNAPWTALGTPSATVPMPVGNALPLGLQLTADRGEDARVLQAAVRVEKALRQS